MNIKIVDLLNIYCDVKYPNMRFITIYSLFELSDIKYQESEWSKPKRFVGDEFGSILENLNCDDDVVSELQEFEKDVCENDVIVDQEEAKALYKFCFFLRKVSRELGCNQPNEVYFNSPLWHKLAKVSKKALDIFLKNEEEAKKTNPCPWQDGDPVGKEWVTERERRLLQMGYHKITDQDGKQEWVKL